MSGLEAVKPALWYEIKAPQLMETTERADEVFYAWPLQMAEKHWVDMREFDEAFTKALELLHPQEVNRVMLQESLAEAHLIRSRSY